MEHKFKMIQMNLFTKQKQNHQFQKQTYSYQRENMSGDKLGVWNDIYTLLLLLLSHFSCVRLCDSIDGSPPGSPVPGILQQEHWSGLPFPSPMHESEK